jgi:hypothetical protein
MQTKNLESGRVLVVEKPEGMGRYIVRATIHCDYGSISWFDKFTDRESTSIIPKGSWQLLGIGSEITEKVAATLVKETGEVEVLMDFNAGGGGRMKWDAYFNYQTGHYGLNTAEESGHSLIRSLGYEPEKCIVLFEPKK